jgi:hypothetical protein
VTVDRMLLLICVCTCICILIVGMPIPVFEGTIRRNRTQHSGMVLMRYQVVSQEG